MKLYALVKGLVRYSWLVALIVAIWSNIFIYIFQQPANKPILYSLLVGPASADRTHIGYR